MSLKQDALENEVGAALWRGIDLSGVTLLLGTGTGRLIELLLAQVSRADGQLLVADTHLPRLQRLEPLGERAPLLTLRARYHRLPLLGESVDLLVLNGVLREVPESKVEVLFNELWRVLVPGGTLRISDIIEPSEESYDAAWRERNRLVRQLSAALDRPAALSVDLPRAARLLRDTGYEDLSCALLPGCPLSDAWLEDTVNALQAMAAQVVEREARDRFVRTEIPRLVAAYAEGGQRAAARFVLSGRKVGNLALDMRASFTEDDLAPEE